MSTNEEPRIPARVSALLDGWPVELTFDIAPARLGAALAKLAELGYTPGMPLASAAPAQQGQRAKVEAAYMPDGTACCPLHLKPLKQGRYGLYCPAKDDGPENKNGFCSFTVKA